MFGLPHLFSLAVSTTVEFDCHGRRVASRRRGRTVRAPRMERGEEIELAGGSRYVIEELLGRGGMGHVYRARRLSDGRMVAIKVAALQPGKNYNRYLRQEAKHLMRLDHRHIIKLLEHGRLAGGRYCLALDYADGRTLDQLLNDGPMSLERAVDICQQVADALEHCHAAGLVHGDLKPANIMVCRRGGADHVCVLDFGIAGFENRGRSGPDKSSPLSVFYMSPEQMLNKPHTRKTDTYQIGLLFFECLFGCLPFKRSVEDAVQYRLRGKRLVTPRDQRLSCSRYWPSIARILRRALSQCPSTRYASAADLSADLRQLLRQIQSGP